MFDTKKGVNMKTLGKEFYDALSPLFQMTQGCANMYQWARETIFCDLADKLIGLADHYTAHYTKLGSENSKECQMIASFKTAMKRCTTLAAFLNPEPPSSSAYSK